MSPVPALEGVKSASGRQMLFLRDLLPFQQARLRGFSGPRHQQVGMLKLHPGGGDALHEQGFERVRGFVLQ